MSTQKTVEIQNNKVLTITARKNGFKPITKSIIVTQNQIQNITMIPSDSPSDIFTLGDRLFGISTFFSYFTPSGTYDTTSLYYISAKQTVGTSLTNVSVAKSQWLSYVEGTLSIATTQGSSNSFVFTYNGSTWDLTGATTISGITATELQDNFGITFSGTPTTDDVITVTETYYNKFACFVLDANYRSNRNWGPDNQLILNPRYSRSTWSNCVESATYFTEYAIAHSGSFNSLAISTCYNKGSFLLPNKQILRPLLPNTVELKNIYNNRVYLDSCDAIIQSGITDFNLSNWNFNRGYAWSCIEESNGSAVALASNGNFANTSKSYDASQANIGIIPIFELPCM